MEFIKMHGLGNDFVIINSLTNTTPITDYVQLAVRVCNRNFGVGADGLVVLLPSDKAHVTMRIFNPDGSEAEMCGNATRCVARYLYEKEIVKEQLITISTLAGLIITEVIVDGLTVKNIKVNMGSPRLKPEEIPTTLSGNPEVINQSIEINGQHFAVTCVSMGNPHCIIYVEDLVEVPLEKWGPLVEKASVFPAYTNVEFVQVINKSTVKVKVWERGAGATLACGTGACAVAVAGVLNGKNNRDVEVILPGGSLHIKWSKQDNMVYMTGAAEYVFEGNLLNKLTKG
ncbi:diaminopimelate epimerase [Desulfitibacter alkalitolerans]|uniref:diaminopimelate epimerase n=1 Tax=Desulfitibacter alkalitolerans TaxID=264641 RepID=UPI00048909AE|nr:diaminopimelate epimerase [Desulfitibacter alkalitolerans]